MIVAKIEFVPFISGIDEEFMNGKQNVTLVSFQIPFLTFFRFYASIQLNGKPTDFYYAFRFNSQTYVWRSAYR